MKSFSQNALISGTLSLLFACGDPAITKIGQDESAEPIETIRQEALDGALAIIASYFAPEPDTFLTLLADEVPTLGDPQGWLRSKAEFEVVVRAQQPFPAGLDLSEYTMEDYHRTFAPKIMTHEEGIAEFDILQVTNGGWRPIDGEFIYIGWDLKEGMTSTDRFLWNSLNAFIVGKREGEWKLVGFLPTSFVD